jgi:uncharacterized protein DUF1761
MNIAAVLVATVVVTIFSAVWYISLRGQGAALGAAWAARSRPPRWQVPLTLIRSFIVALVVAWLVTSLGIADAMSAVGLALALWVAFPVVLLVGSAAQENVPWKLAAIHAGDWLAKLVIIAVVVSVWR